MHGNRIGTCHHAWEPRRAGLARLLLAVREEQPGKPGSTSASQSRDRQIRLITTDAIDRAK